MSEPIWDGEFVGPEDRPKRESVWELVMYGWQVRTMAAVMEYLHEIAPGGKAVAVRMAPRTEEGVIVAVPCLPKASKAHKVTVSPNRKNLRWSLYTPLLAFAFPKVKADHKAIFSCRPGEYKGAKALLIDVAGYRVERIETDEGGQA